jgi:asparagine synthase (glutamine-hydrolysing)
VPGHLSLGRRSLRLAIAIAIERAPDPTLLCGQGADELFLGYAHFRGLDPGAAEQRAAEDLQRLVNEDWPATQALAVRLGRRIEAPFLHPSFLDAANAIPLERRMPTESTKAFWRRWVVRRGLPEELAARPKKAIQYGSGVDRWLRTMVSGRRPGSPPSR